MSHVLAWAVRTVSLTSLLGSSCVRSATHGLSLSGLTAPGHSSAGTPSRKTVTLLSGVPSGISDASITKVTTSGEPFPGVGAVMWISALLPNTVYAGSDELVVPLGDVWM